MPLACTVAGRSCSFPGIDASRLHPVFWQELPPAGPQRMPLACIVAGRSCRIQGIAAVRLHPLRLAGAAVGEDIPLIDLLRTLSCRRA